MNRDELRRSMRAQRRCLSAGAQLDAARAAGRRIMDLQAYQNARVVMAYVAARGELSLEPVIEDVLASGRVLALPLCESGGEMTARRVESMGQLHPGAYGLLEPAKDCPVIPAEEIDLVLAPGTAFDRAGHRLGQGGGYYDRFLPRTRALRAGVCHAFQLAEAIEAQAHDQRMDVIITPDETTFTGGQP